MSTVFILSLFSLPDIRSWQTREQGSNTRSVLGAPRRDRFVDASQDKMTSRSEPQNTYWLGPEDRDPRSGSVAARTSIRKARFLFGKSDIARHGAPPPLGAIRIVGQPGHRPVMRAADTDVWRSPSTTPQDFQNGFAEPCDWHRPGWRRL